MATALLLSLGLAAATALRVEVSGPSGPRSALGGVLFAAATLVLALAAGWRPGRPHAAGLLAGLVGGAVLCLLPVWAWSRQDGGALDPAALPSWVACVVLVAVVQEVYLRGVLHDAVGRVLGQGGAVVVTALSFGLMHVPLYGWAVFPLDAAVGLWLGWLRVVSGGTTAPATAHVVADLAGWWVR